MVHELCAALWDVRTMGWYTGWYYRGVHYRAHTGMLGTRDYDWALMTNTGLGLIKEMDALRALL